MENANTERAIKDRFIVTVATLYLLVVGFLSGMIADRIRFDETRSVLLARLEEDNHKVHQRLMAIERQETAKKETSRKEHRRIDYE
jgi:hypothetical protein